MSISTNDSATEQLYDRERLAELSNLAIGSRSLREFANQSGLSEGFLSRLTTGKLTSAPTRRSLAKLMAETSRPQNGITLGDMMEAAGYPYTAPEPRIPRRVMSGEGGTVPAEVQNTAFPVYLTAATLEASGQLGQRYSSENQREMFVISSRGGKDIVGIPAFSALDAVEDEIRETKRNLLMAYSIFADEIKDKFVVILTNQPDFYNGFDAVQVAGTGGEFYIALTEDFHSFTKQRPVQTVDIDGETDMDQNKSAAYDFTRMRK